MKKGLLCIAISTCFGIVQILNGHPKAVAAVGYISYGQQQDTSKTKRDTGNRKTRWVDSSRQNKDTARWKDSGKMRRRDTTPLPRKDTIPQK